MSVEREPRAIKIMSNKFVAAQENIHKCVKRGIRSILKIQRSLHLPTAGEIEMNSKLESNLTIVNDFTTSLPTSRCLSYCFDDSSPKFTLNCSSTCRETSESYSMISKDEEKVFLLPFLKSSQGVAG